MTAPIKLLLLGDDSADAEFVRDRAVAIVASTDDGRAIAACGTVRVNRRAARPIGLLARRSTPRSMARCRFSVVPLS